MALPFELRVDPTPPNLSLRRPIVAALPQLGERIFFMARKFQIGQPSHFNDRVGPVKGPTVGRTASSGRSNHAEQVVTSETSERPKSDASDVPDVRRQYDVTLSSDLTAWSMRPQ